MYTHTHTHTHTHNTDSHEHTHTHTHTHGSLKSVKAKKLQVSPVKSSSTKAKTSTPKAADSKVTSHGKSVAMKDLPVVDS